jgi:hypothetical protein
MENLARRLMPARTYGRTYGRTLGTGVIWQRRMISRTWSTGSP